MSLPTAAAEAPDAPKKLTLEALAGDAPLSGPSLLKPKVSPDGKRVAFLRGKERDRNRLDLWAYDVAAQAQRPVCRGFAHARRRRQGAVDEEEARRERQRTAALLRHRRLQLRRPTAGTLLIPLNGDLYVYDLAPSRRPRCAGSPPPTASKPTRASRRARNFVSFVRDQNLYVIDLATGAERAVTREGGGTVSFGMAEFIAQEEMDRDTGYWWAPDERRIALARVDETPVPTCEALRDPGHGRADVVEQRYPGRRRAQCRASICASPISPARRAALQLDLGENADIYLPRVDWFPDARDSPCSARAATRRRSSCCASTRPPARERVLLTERSEHLGAAARRAHVPAGAPQFIWASSRDGYQHLYLTATTAS